MCSLALGLLSRTKGEMHSSAMFIVLFCLVSKIGHVCIDATDHIMQIVITECSYGGATFSADMIISKNMYFKNKSIECWGKSFRSETALRTCEGTVKDDTKGGNMLKR